MKTQAWGWLAAGVLAAGLNASYHDGGLRWCHRITDRVEHNTAAVLALASGRADAFLTEARLVTAENDGASCPLVKVWTRVQASVDGSEVPTIRVQEVSDREEEISDRVQALSDREQAVLDRLEARRVRVSNVLAAKSARLQLRMIRFDSPNFNVTPHCPRLRMSMPQVPAINVQVPEVQVEVGAGPV